MKVRREMTEILRDIDRGLPGFDKEDLLNYTKWAILNLHEEFKNGQTNKNTVRCKNEFINKLINEKEKYRMTTNIDHITVQHVKLYDSIKENEETIIKVYASIYFYDDENNNIENAEDNESYWNDIWIITYRDAKTNKLEDGKCKNCGAIMNYNQMKKIFKCDYCGNVVTTQKWNRDWEILDIEVEN